MSGMTNKKLKTRKVGFTPVVNTPINGSDAWIPFTTENDFVVNAETGLMPVYDMHTGYGGLWSYPREVFSPTNVDEYERLLGEIGPHVNTMRAKLRRALMTKIERRWDGGYTTGRLDPRRLVDAVRGVPEVFRRREAEQFIDTAVQILVDLSGSMATDNRIRMAAQASIALANALEGTGVTYEIIGFQDPFLNGLTPELAKELGKGMEEKKMALPGKPATFGRYTPHMLVEFKPFAKRLRDCRAGLGGIASAAGGANNDIDALIYARERLMKRDETRKVMIILSDGKPAPVSDFDTNWVEHMMRKTVAQIEASRLIEIVGIGIQSDCVSKFYKHYSVLRSPEELPRTVIDQVARILLGGRFQIDNAKLLGAA